MPYPPNGSLLNFPFTQNGVPVFGSQDASGTTVIPIANYTNHNGLWLPHPTDNNGYPIQAAQGTAPQTSGTTGTIASTNTATTFTIPVGSLTFGAGLFDAKQATVRIANVGTSQTITQVQLQLSDTVGAVSIPVTYTQSVSIASGATGVVVIPLTQGIGSQVSVIVTFGTAPTAGSVSVGIDWQSAGSALNHIAVTQSGVWNVGVSGSIPAGSNTIGAVTQGSAPWTVNKVGHNTVLGTYSVTFAASAAAGTVETVSVPLPSTYQDEALYLVAINNPSGLGTAVTVTFQNGMKFGSTSVLYTTVTSVNVASGAIQAYLIQGWLLGDAAAQINVTNSSAASSSGGTVQIEVVMV